MKSRRWLSPLLIMLVAATASAVPVTDGLIVHLRAEDLNLADGAAVTLWPDVAVADAFDGTVMTVAGQATPTYKASGYNGLPAVSFDDTVSGQVLVSDVYSWDETQGVTIIFFCTGGVNDSNDRVVTVGDRGGLGGANMSCDISGNNKMPNGKGSGARVNNGWILTSDVSANPVVPLQWQTFVYQMPQSAPYEAGMFYAVDDLTPIVLESNNPSNVMTFQAGNNAMFVGNGVNTSGNWLGDGYRGDLAEVLVYNSQLTLEQMQEVLNFLEKKYAKQTAHNPGPASGSEGQGTPVGNQVEVELSWNTGLDPAGVGPDGRISEHQLYLTTDPTFAAVATPIVVSAGSPTEATASHTAMLELDGTYYWRVDEVVNDPDPNIVSGPVWTFKTRKSIPIIQEQPTDQAVFAGETAEFTVGATSISELSYTWYHSEDESAETPADDSEAGTGQTLSIADAALSHEGYYYCVVSNTGGDVASGTASLAIKRAVAYWTLDAADYVGGQYLDSSGEGHHADPNLHPDASQFVAGVAAGTAEGLDLSVKPLSAGRTADWAPAKYTGEVTVSAWLNWSGANGSWQGVLCSRSDTAINFLIEIRANNSNVQVNSNYFPALAGANLPTGQWSHLAMTVGPEAIAIYLDGVEVGSRSPGVAIHQEVVPALLGAISYSSEGMLESPFYGVMDEVQVFNYAMSHLEVVEELFYPISGTGVCVFPPAFDWAGGGVAGDEPDCVVNLADFAAMVSEWLECGLLPEFVCDLP